MLRTRSSIRLVTRWPLTMARVSSSPHNFNFSSSANIKSQREAQAKVEHIREELLVLMGQQKKQRDDNNQGLFVAIIKTITKHKQELINIFASLACVLLAYQLLGMRTGRNRIENQLDQLGKAMERKEAILLSLSQDEAFANKVAKRIHEAMVPTQESWWFWSHSQMSDEDRVALVATIVYQELKERIGTAGLTEEKVKELKMKELQKLKMQQQGEEEQQMLQLSLGVLNDTQHAIIEQVVQETGEDGTTVVTKRKIMM